MVQKRLFTNEESYEVSSKHPRQMEFSNQLVSFLEFIPDGYTEQPPNIPGESKDSFTDLPTEKGSKTGIPGCLYNVSWDSSSISEEDDESEEPFHLSSSPVYYSPVRPVRTAVRSEETYASLLNCPPRKLVPVGPDFQADVPEWPVQGTKNISDSSYGSEPLTLVHQTSEFDLSGPSEDGIRWLGLVLFQLPDYHRLVTGLEMVEPIAAVGILGLSDVSGNISKKQEKSNGEPLGRKDFRSWGSLIWER
ncbi:uncharacterized protein LOC130760959 [Actinidia eriantha]|uniref:uncharacterized protein LOC130760959 n=1 Tax=Actinidia eriantha TaxID=165200 RepID=UPI00258EA1AC|nr:uncharacterized protein LOC130760959 [Actinidia eriantha]XP_057472364.1 uncharacterized protein LOC130760959 [Actinidia eriantha]